jgi:hypothetical protein
MTITLAVLMMLAMTACSSNGSSANGASGSGGKPMTATELASKVGCSGYSNSSTEMYVKEGGDCTLNGQTISIDTFNDNTARDNYVKVARSFGGVYGQGDGWVIHGDDSGVVGDAVKAAGGAML